MHIVMIYAMCSPLSSFRFLFLSFVYCRSFKRSKSILSFGYPIVLKVVNSNASLRRNRWYVSTIMRLLFLSIAALFRCCFDLVNQWRMISQHLLPIYLKQSARDRHANQQQEHYYRSLPPPALPLPHIDGFLPSCC